MYRLALIGCGKMGQALLRGIVQSGVLTGADILVCDLRREPLAEVLAETGAQFTTSTMDVVSQASAILLAVKPKDLPGVLMELPPGLLNGKLVVSVAAGITLQQLASYLSRGARIVRAMPNTPALIGKGVTAYAVEGDVTAEDKLFLDKIFGSVGVVHVVDEALLDAVTGLSGSGPAYVFTIIEALADGGVRCGLPRPLALDLAARTVAGAAELVAATGQHPAVLRDAVASPGGTTIAGIAALEAGGLRHALIDAVSAATQRGRELGHVHDTQVKERTDADG